MTLGKTDADIVVNPQHFGNGPADIRIQIRIYLEIHIRIPDHVSLRLDALAEVCALCTQSTYVHIFLCLHVGIASAHILNACIIIQQKENSDFKPGQMEPA